MFVVVDGQLTVVWRSSTFCCVICWKSSKKFIITLIGYLIGYLLHPADTC